MSHIVQAFENWPKRNAYNKQNVWSFTAVKKRRDELGKIYQKSDIKSFIVTQNIWLLIQEETVVAI